MFCVRILTNAIDPPTYLIAPTETEAEQQLDQYREDHPYAQGKVEFWHSKKNRDVRFIKELVLGGLNEL